MKAPEPFWPEDWQEDDYLQRYSDVRIAVTAGQFASGWQHYQMYGRAEGRVTSRDEPVTDGSERQTRHCFDPWTYLEITPMRGLKPCCKIGEFELEAWRKGEQSLMEAWQEPAFQQLRGELIEGQLNAVCSTCHIRPWIPVEEFAQLVSAQGFGLQPGPLRSLRVEVTTACNLRCTYCPVSQPWYEARSMSLDTFEQVLALLENQDPAVLDLHLNGHGETTTHPRWLPFARRVLALGFRPTLITNLSRPLSDEEAATLARFSVICVSLDTLDADLLRRIRRGLELEVLETNLRRIRDFAGEFSPYFALSSGVYDKTVIDLESLGDFCQKYDIRRITFWQLVKYPDVPDGLNARSIPSLPEPERRACVEAFEMALISIRAKGITVEVAGEFLHEWKKTLSAG